MLPALHDPVSWVHLRLFLSRLHQPQSHFSMWPLALLFHVLPVFSVLLTNVNAWGPPRSSRLAHRIFTPIRASFPAAPWKCHWDLSSRIYLFSKRRVQRKSAIIPRPTVSLAFTTVGTGCLSDPCLLVHASYRIIQTQTSGC